MTPQHIPFNGDTFIGPEIRRLVSRFGIKSIIETGTWSAHSTREFRKMVPGEVITIDSTHEHLIEEFGATAVKDLEDAGIIPELGDSSVVLRDMLLWAGPPILIYLDAHYGGANGSNVNPLPEELGIIGKSVTCIDSCVICIHDFFVPGKPWGYNGGDWGRGFEPYSYELIAPKLPAIYPGGHAYHYNEQADGAQRGIIYIYPSNEKR